MIHVTVRSGSEEVALELAEEQSCADLAQWVRSRFQPPSGCQVVFSSPEGRELIPTYHRLKLMPEKERLVVVSFIEDADSDGVLSTKKQQKKQSWQLRYWYPLFALLLLCVVLKSENIPMVVQVVHWYHHLWNHYLGIALPEKVIIDALTTLITYPVTTFYIRRLLNPDTGGSEASFEKYGSDVLFAALGSVAMSHIKFILKAHIISENVASS